MNTQDAMKFVESELEIVRMTPCEVCGGEYLQNYQDIISIEDHLYDILYCICSNCGHEKIFEFYAPYLEDIKTKSKKHKKLYN